jgi:hypothetical protein
MFLNQLNLKQRKAFIELAYYTAKIDSVFAEEEKYFIESYKAEAGIEYYDIENHDFDKMTAEFQDKKSKNIALLEITALIHADKKVTIEESQLLKDLQKKLNFTNEEMKDSENWVKNYFELLERGANFINA